MASRAEQPPHGGTSAAQTIASAGDRVRAFKSARRHSWLVRLLKLTLPVGALAAVGGYGAILALNSKLPKDAKIEIGPTQISSSHLKMEAPKYSGVGTDGSRYRVKAREAITDLKMSGPVRLNVIEGDITQTTGIVTDLKAAWGTYDTKTETLELYEKIDIDGSSGMRARLTRATVFAKESRVVSNERLIAETENGTIQSNSMILLTKARQAAFKGDVQVRLKANPAAAQAALANEQAKKPAAAMPGLAANSGQPIDVTSEQLDIDDTSKTALFRRSVVARQGDAVLESQELDVLYEGRASPDQPGPAAADVPKAEQARLKSVAARGGVVMTNKDDKVTSDTMDYEAASERVVLTGSVVIRSGADRGATAQRAELDQKADTALLTGEVVVTQAKNVLRGRRLFVDRKSSRMRLESPAEAGRAAGRIYTLFYQGDQKTGSVPQKKSESAPANPFATTFKTDPAAPIEIEAETLDVTDATKTAVFKVNVIAKQGDFTVRTGEMTAFYTGQAMALTPGQPVPKKGPGAEPGQAAQLTRIEARNKVHITSRDGQTATGDAADFDVKGNTVVLTGDVAVKQGQSVTTGSRIQINLTTGEVRNLTPAVAATVTPVSPAIPGQKDSRTATKGPAISAAESGTSTTCPQGVVCKTNRPALVLYPEELKAQAKQRADDAAKAKGIAIPDAKLKKPRIKPSTADSAWEAITAPNAARQP